MTYYEILEVVPTASPEVIRAAYLAQAKKYHPDVCDDVFQGAEKMRLLNEAYSVLSDPHQRRIYDDSLLRIKSQTSKQSFYDDKPYDGGETFKKTETNYNTQKNTPKSNKSVKRKHYLNKITLIFSIVFMSVIMIIPIVLPFFSKSSPKPSHETTSTPETSKSYEKPSNETSALVYTPPKKSSNETSAILYTPKETKKLAVQPEPLSGQILKKNTYISDIYKSSITIKADDSSSVVVKLKDIYNNTVLSFYVRAGKSAVVDVPQEKLQVYFASGKNWYGEDDLFGKDTVYSKDDDYLDFGEYTWEYTLSPVYNGNFKQTPSDAEEFED